MFVVDHVRPCVGPQVFVPVPVFLFVETRAQQRGGGQRFGLHPEILVVVADEAVPADRCAVHARLPARLRREAVVHAAALGVPGPRHRVVEQVARHRCEPIGGDVAVEDQQQLGPFGLVAGLEAPWAEQILRIVEVVVPVDVPVGVVVFPDQAAGLGCLPAGHVARQQQRAIQPARVAARLVSRQHRLAHVHVGVLAAVIADVPVGVGLVLVQAVFGLPEARLQQDPDFLHPVARIADPSHQRVRIRQQHEGQSVAMVGAVFRHAVTNGPGVAAGFGVEVHLAQITQAMQHRLAIFLVAEFARRHRVVEDEARTAHEVPMTGVVDAAVVLEVMEETAGRIDAARVVERHRLRDVRAQEFRRAEVRLFHGRPRPAAIE